MSYYTESIDRMVLIRGPGMASFTNAYLGQGLSSLGYKASCSVKVIDIYGSFEISYTDVTVRPPDDPKEIINNLKVLIQNGKETSNFDKVSQVISGTILTINQVNCSLSPNCSPLNRQICSDTPNSCGKCLSGFVGIPEPSNFPCLPVQRKTPQGSRRKLVSTSCTDSKSCLLGVCVNDICMESMKKCRNDCSTHGTCSYIDMNGNSVLECKESDLTCDVVCKCLTGWAGSDCSLSNVEFQSSRSSRELICMTFIDLARSQEISTEIIISTLVSISSTMFDGSLITDLALDNCIAAVESIILTNINLVNSEESVLSLLNVISNIIGARDIFSQSTIQKYDTLLRATSTAQRNLLSLGEPNSLAVSKYLKISTGFISKAVLRDENNIEIDMQTDFENMLGLTGTKVSIPPYELEDQKTIGISIFQLTKNPYDILTNTSIIQIEMLSYDSNISISDVYIATHSISPIDYPIFSIVPHELSCDLSEQPYKINVTCAPVDYVNTYSTNETLESVKSSNSTYLCMGNLYGSLTYYCPGYVYTPKCLVSNHMGTFQESSYCNVLNFSSNSITYSSKFSNSEQHSITEVTVYKGVNILNKALNYTTFATKNPSIPIKANQVLINAFSIASAIFFFLFYGFKYRKSNNDKNKPFVDKNKADEIDSDFSSVSNDNITMSNFFKFIIPEEFENKFSPLLLKCFFISRKRNIFNQFFSIPKKNQYLIFINIAGQILNHTLVTFIIISYYQSDTGECELLKTKESCLDDYAIDFKSNLCYWERVGEYCYFNSPNFDIFYLIRFIVLICIAVIPLNYLLTYLILSIDTILLADTNSSNSKSSSKVYIEESNNYQSRESNQENQGYKSAKDILKSQLEKEKVLSAELSKNEIRRPNIFRDLQTKQSILWSAARMSQLKNTSDLLIPVDEADLLINLCHDKNICSLWAPQKEFKFDRSWQFLGMLEYAIHIFQLYFASQYGQPHIASQIVYTQSKSLIQNKLTSARREEGNISDVLGAIPDEASQDLYLIQAFALHMSDFWKFNYYNSAILNSNSHYYLKAVYPYLGNDKIVDFIVFSYLLIITMCILSYGSKIGDRVLTYALTGIIISFGYNYVLLQPLCQVVLHNFYRIFIGFQYTNILCAFKSKIRGILKRKYGILSTKYSLIQHFNPACRVARQFSHLGASRILLLIHDFDVPSFSIYPKKSIFSVLLLFPYEFLSLCVNFLGIFPSDITKFIFEAIIICAINLVPFYLHDFISLDFGAQIYLTIVLGCILVILALQIVYIERNQRKWQVKISKEIRLGSSLRNKPQPKTSMFQDNNEDTRMFDGLTKSKMQSTELFVTKSKENQITLSPKNNDFSVYKNSHSSLDFFTPEKSLEIKKDKYSPSFESSNYIIETNSSSPTWLTTIQGPPKGSPMNKIVNGQNMAGRFDRSVSGEINSDYRAPWVSKGKHFQAFYPNYSKNINSIYSRNILFHI